MKPFLLVTLVTSAGMAGAALVGCGDDVGARPSPDASVDGGVLPPDDAGDGDAADPDARAPFDAAAPTIECAVTPCMTRLVAGPTHYCAVANDGVVRCWGNPSALGDFASSNPSGDPGATPVVLDGITDVVDIAASSLRTCVVRSDGHVDCFGRDMPKPTRVSEISNAKKLAIGDERSCAIVADGALSCWGDSDETGLGAGPVALAGKAAAAAISAPVAFVVDEEGGLFSWGADPTMLGRDTPLAVDWTPGRVEIPPTLQIATSDRHACAVTKDGRLFCWGHGDDGALGLGSIRSVSVPTEVFFPGPAWPAQVAASVTHSCVRMTDGAVSCWARKNASGELGYGDQTGVFIPTKVTFPKSVAAVATGIGSTCVLATDGSISCWGDNAYGQLGLGRRDVDRHWQPTTVVFP